MPKKPKHIQEFVEELIRKNLTAKEIINKVKNEKNHTVSTSYISSRKKVMETQNDETPNNAPSNILYQEISEHSVYLLYNLMGRLGMKNLDDTIQVISEDYRKLIEIKSRYDLDNEKTIAQVFSEFEEPYRVLNSLDKDKSKLEIAERVRELYPIQNFFYKILNLESLIGYDVHFLDFLSEFTHKYIEEVIGLHGKIEYRSANKIRLLE